MIQKTEVDTTLDELHRTRERLAAKFGGDIQAILEDARRRQAVSLRPLWPGKTLIQTVRSSSESAEQGQHRRE